MATLTDGGPPAGPYILIPAGTTLSADGSSWEPPIATLPAPNADPSRILDVTYLAGVSRWGIGYWSSCLPVGAITAATGTGTLTLTLQAPVFGSTLHDTRVYVPPGGWDGIGPDTFQVIGGPWTITAAQVQAAGTLDLGTTFPLPSPCRARDANPLSDVGVRWTIDGGATFTLGLGVVGRPLQQDPVGT